MFSVSPVLCVRACFVDSLLNLEMSPHGQAILNQRAYRTLQETGLSVQTTILVHWRDFTVTGRGQQGLYMEVHEYGAGII